MRWILIYNKPFDETYFFVLSYVKPLHDHACFRPTDGRGTDTPNAKLTYVLQRRLLSSHTAARHAAALTTPLPLV